MSCILSIDAGGTSFKSAVVSDSGNIVGGTLMSVKVSNTGTADEIKDCYQTILYEQLKHGISIDAVAVDTPGPFDYINGMSLMQHKFQSIYGVPLRPWINEIINGEVIFVHDSTAFMYGEAWKSPLSKYSCIGGVMIGTGLGFAIMRGGKVLENENGGPYRSIYKLPLDGRTAEDYISGRGIVERYGDLSLTALDVAKLAEKGDEKAYEAYSVMGSLLARILKPAADELGIQAIVLGGQISKSYKMFIEPLKSGLPDVEVIPSSRFDTSHLLGAAYYAIEYGDKYDTFRQT